MTQKLTQLGLQLQGVELKTNGLSFSSVPSIEEWLKVGEILRQLQGAIQWYIGDWLLYGEQNWNEMSSQALWGSHYDYKTLMNWKWVASRVPPSRRRENLSWSAHAEVAALEPARQALILKDNNLMTKQQVRAAVLKITGEQIKEKPAKLCPHCGGEL